MSGEVLLLRGWGLLRFGMGRADVRAIVRGSVQSRKRGPSAATAYDFFPGQGIFAYYKSDETLEAVELTKPAAALIEGVDLLDASIERIELFLNSKSGSVERTLDGLTYKELGVSIYAPDRMEDPRSKPESVLIFCTGYFD
ncbi:MAG: hypothetical protein WAM21_16120 [Steroidobacteraceae bacterium]